MSVVNMSREIKKVHPEYVVFYKVGSFIQCFGKDTYIICYMFGYNIRDTKDNIPTCGFPKNATPKITSKLEHKKINYMIIDVRNNYDVDFKSDNGNLNQYNVILEEANKYVKVKRRIDRISKTLENEMYNENIINKIEKIEEIVYEGRKI